MDRFGHQGPDGKVQQFRGSKLRYDWFEQGSNSFAITKQKNPEQ